MKKFQKVLLGGLLSAAPLALVMLTILPASAAQMQNRVIEVDTALPGASAQHAYRFDVASSSNIASISFEYCDNTPIIQITCSAPNGLDVTSATLSSQTTNTGFAISVPDTTANRIVINRPSAAMVTATTTYTFDNVINSTDLNNTTYVRISTHASSDASGPFTDEGSVAFSTGPSGFNVGTYVPPFLTFCVGQTVSLNCSSISGLLADFGELSSNSTATATTQFAAATNDFSGYNIFIDGQTLTAGNSIVAPMTTNGGSNTGTGQFGVNLRSNSSPSVGANTSGPGAGAPATNYGNTNSFRFVPGELIARSTQATDFTRYTSSYIVNVPDDQPPGVYATTITYLAVASF